MAKTDKPTEEQVEEFWKWCGFEYVEKIEKSKNWGEFDFS